MQGRKSQQKGVIDCSPNGDQREGRGGDGRILGGRERERQRNRQRKRERREARQ